jgi:hypothetical protein
MVVVLPRACIIAWYRISHLTEASLFNTSLLQNVFAAHGQKIHMKTVVKVRSYLPAKSRWVSPYRALIIFDHFWLCLWISSIPTRIYLRGLLERAWWKTCRSWSTFVNVPCASVEALFLALRGSECWVFGLQLLMSETLSLSCSDFLFVHHLN